MASLLLVILALAFSCSISSSAVQSYRKELRTKVEVNQLPIRQLGHSVQSSRVDPSRVIQLSWRPRAFLYKGFLSNEECDHLISLAHGKLERSLREDHDSTNSIQLKSSGTPLGIEEDDIVARIEDRISAWTFLPKENSAHVKIMRYVPEEATQHLNYYADEAKVGSGDPLVASVLLFLSDATKGGETIFLESELKDSQPKDDTWSDCAKKGYAVKPSKGNALLFFSSQVDAAPDGSSPSARCPVLENEQWCATKFFYTKSIVTKKSSEESDSDGCKDEDDNCVQWALMGECQRNPVYMIGTPDYYGSCRKSCQVC